MSAFRQCDTGLVIHVDQIVVEIKRELQTIGQRHLYVTPVTVYGMNLHPWKLH